MLCNSYNCKNFIRRISLNISTRRQNYYWLLLITGLYLKSKSFTTYRVTLYDDILVENRRKTYPTLIWHVPLG